MSETITLKDDCYRIIGYVEVKDNGDKVVKDEHYFILAYYEARNEVTKDKYFRIIGHKDILNSLFH